MEYLDPVTNERYIPYCIEPSLGADRVALAFLCDAYDEEELEGRRHARGAAPASRRSRPFKAAVLPLQKNKLGDKAREVYTKLCQALYGGLRRNRLHWQALPPAGRGRARPCASPWTLIRWKTGKVTVRDRDTMQQELVAIEDLAAYIDQKIDF